MSATHLPGAAAAAALLALAAPVQAQESGWVGQLTPYVWASGIGGTITPFTGAPGIDIDNSFSEVLEDLDGAFFLSGFARNGRFVVLGDFSYSKSSKQGLVPPGVPASGELEQTSLTLAAGYRVSEGPELTFDVLGGARIWRIRGAVEVPLAGVSRSPRLSFTDPILAARVNAQLGGPWSAILYADVGGFGVGSDSTSQIVATVNYRMNDNLYLSAGYRTLAVDYRDGGTEVDMRMGGPLFGVTWRF